ncbi:hypothetical protein D1815_06570 [Aquimarina sp. AD1]|uniref:hypothetical protein n=1 Tax=Aquimarina sp. (strain AD1) TaxID=1714848 RepID=UPI000E50719A|nr:hypothetical protein [Aquimarina sp. AD1]AXT55438.1 hypothetical protein D1815_06570 [Aquimarina sp. AD1]RKN26346.1 hypothetical protein D7035_09510 [Aquimarina sp. AD1]
MPIKITLLFLLISFVSISAQNQIPNTEELFGKWIIEKDSYNKFKTYLINAELENTNVSTRINIFRDVYTGTLKMEYVKPVGTKYNTPRPRCGNGPKLIKNVKGNYEAYTVCAYDPKNGKLKVLDPSFIDGKLFYVKKIGIEEIALIKIK